MVFYNKKKLPPPPRIPITIDEIPLIRVEEKRILGIIIDEALTFTPHIELTTTKCRSAYNRLSLYPDLSPNVALQLYKAYIRPKLEYGCMIWGYKIHQKIHVKKLESPQRGALLLILRTMKSTLTDALEAELLTTPRSSS